MAKRKREVSSVSPSSSNPSTSSTPVIDKHKHKRRKEHDDPKIIYELADGSNRLQRRLGKDKSLADALYKVTKKLNISTPGSIRLAQVREGGREVEIYDEFDFDAFKQRSRATQKTSVVVKVYPGGRPSEPASASASSSAFSTPTSAGPSSRPFSPATPRSILSSPSPSTSKSVAARKKGKKRVSIIEPSSITTPPSKNVSQSPTHASPGSKKKKNKDNNKASSPATGASSPKTPVVGTSNLKVPEGLNVSARVLDILSKYKPAKPSPLRKPTQIDSDTSEVESDKEKTKEPAGTPAPKKRRRARKSVDAKAGNQSVTPGHVDSAKNASAPADTAARGTAQPLPIESPEPEENATLPDVSQDSPAAESATASASKITAQPESHAQPEATASSHDETQTPTPSVKTPISAADSTPEQAKLPKKKRASRGSNVPAEFAAANPSEEKSEGKADASPPAAPAAILLPSAASTSADTPATPSGVPSPTLPSASLDLSRSESRTEAVTPALNASEEVSTFHDVPALPATPASDKSSKPVIIHLASPWILQCKPEEPITAADYSSSSIESPKRKKKAPSTPRRSKNSEATATETAEILVPDSQPSPISGSRTLASVVPEVEERSDSAVHQSDEVSEGPAVEAEPAATDLQATTSADIAPDGSVSTVPSAEAEIASSASTPKTKKKGRKSETSKGNIASEIMAQFRAQKAAELAADGSDSASTETAAPTETSLPEPETSVGTTSVQTDGDFVPETADSSAVSSHLAGGEDAAVVPTPGPASVIDGGESHSGAKQSVSETAKVSASDVPVVAGEPSEAEGATPSKSVAGTAAAKTNDDEGGQESDLPRRRTRQAAKPANKVLANGQSESRSSATSKAAESPGAPPSGGSNPVGWWSDHADGMRKGGREEIAILASRSACIICGQTPTHLQKDCPEVLKGRDNLTSLLAAREEQIAQLGEAVVDTPVKTKGRKGRKQVVEEGERLSMAKESVDVIKRWIDLLQKRETAKKRLSASSAQFQSYSVREQANGNTAADVEPATNDAEDVILPTEPLEQPVLAPGVEPETVTTCTDVASDQPSLTISDIPTGAATQTKSPGKDSNGIDAAQTSLEEEAMSSFPLHQLALQRMNRKKRPGSLSGLSASDAVIETGDSDSDSSDSDFDSAPRSPVASILGGADMSDSDSDSAYSDIDDDHEDMPSVSPALIEDQPESEDGDNEDSESGSGSSSSGSSDSGSDSDNDATSHSSFPSRSPTPSVDSFAGDAETSMLQFLSQPLSAKEKRRARLSAASAAPTQNVDIEMDVDMPPSETEDIEDDETPLPPRPSGRRGSDSSIDIGVDDDEKMDVDDDEILPSSLTQPPTLVQSDIDEDESLSKDDDKVSSTRSFVDLDRDAGLSPAVDSFEGAIALEEAIREERAPLVLVEETLNGNPVDSTASQGGSSLAPSQEEAVVPTQAKDMTPRPRKSARGTLASQTKEDQSQEPSKSQSTQDSVPGEQSLPGQSLRRSSRRSASVTTSPIQSTQGLLNASVPPQTPTRRLRSASRDLPDPVPSPSVARRGSTSQQSTISVTSVQPNGTPRGRKASATASPEQRRRVTRSRSLATPDRAVLPTSSQVNGLQLELIEEQETPKATKIKSANVTPVSQIEDRESSAAIPEQTPSDSDSDTHTPTAARIAKTQPSPLFMSQGSQVPKTQHYTMQDSSMPVESVTSHRNGDVRSSPIPEEDEDAQSDDGEAASVQTSSDEDEADLPPIRPIAAIRRTASQGPPVLMPTLSGLDSTLLRAGKTRNGLRNSTASQPAPKTKMLIESESEVSSSSEDEAPAHRNRYATGRNVKNRRSKTGGVMRGW